MSPMPGTDPVRDELAADVLEHLVTTPPRTAMRHVTIDGLSRPRRPGDLLLLNAVLPGQAQVTTSFSPRDAAELLREVADRIETGDHA